jgi:predicted enzyme related to lactoylglutathione lyase
MEMYLHGLNWFEIPVQDFERARKFYSEIFDYEMPEMMMGPNRMGFFLYDLKSGGVGGAIIHGEGFVPHQHGTLVYLNAGNDLNEIISKIDKAGGKIVLPKTAIPPNLGYYILIIDPEGNRVGIHSKN